MLYIWKIGPPCNMHSKMAEHRTSKKERDRKKVQFSENQTVMHKNLISINLSKCCQLISEDNWPWQQQELFAQRRPLSSTNIYQIKLKANSYKKYSRIILNLRLLPTYRIFCGSCRPARTPKHWSLRPCFSINPTFENSLKVPSYLLSRSGILIEFLRKPTSQKPTSSK